jgi:hypothetical protein
LWTKDMGIEMLDGAQYSLPRYRQPYDRTTEGTNDSDGHTPVPKTGIDVLPGRIREVSCV